MKVHTVISLKYMELNTTFSYCVFVFGKAKNPTKTFTKQLKIKNSQNYLNADYHSYYSPIHTVSKA